MIILKGIIYLFGLALILIDIVLILIIWYFANYKQNTFIVKVEPEEKDYFEEAKKIIRKEGTE